MAKITENTLIAECLELNPNAAEILMSAGMHCFGCALAHGETIAEAVAVHGEDLNALLAKIFLLLGLWLLPVLPASALTELLTVHLEIGCHILSIGVVTFYSFLGHKYFSFNEGIRAFWKKRRGSHAC